MIKKISKYQAANAIAISFHCIGLAGLLFFDRIFFIRAAPFNLLLSFLLLVWTQKAKNIAFFLFLVLVLLIGYFLEVAGVNTGLLFGNYTYSNVLGAGWMGVPFLIGINWFIIIYCCGVSMQTLLSNLIKKAANGNNKAPRVLRAMSVIIDGATLAVVFDWLMEPVAVKLGFWNWNGDGSIPLYNYICWLMISMLLLTIFHFLRFNKENKFAINLLLIQALFFLILRTFFE